TRNQFYFENLATLQMILTAAGFETRIGTMSEEITQATTFKLDSGKEIILEPLIRQENCVGVEGFCSAAIILNNDLSAGVPEILQNLSQRIMPATELGWANRLKSDHFRFYEVVVHEFASEFDLDPWLLMPYFDQCPEVDFMQQEGQQCLVQRAEGLLKRVQRKYNEYGIKDAPFAVVKADQGTYGMAVMMIKDPQELLALNRKQRTRMSTLKGGQAVTRAIIQEGVYSFETLGEANVVAEPVVYLFGRHVVGGFYRVHKNRGPDENLNAPGMNFEPMAFVQDCFCPQKNPNANPQFYLYGIIARLAMLAGARELAEFSQQGS
nr:glutamate--cysteine ligase [Gammaproteobacteria bacterium]